MQFYTTDNLPSNIMKRSFTANLMRISPNGKAPLLALSGMARTKRIKGIAHFFWVKRAVFPQFTVAANALATDVALQVDSTMDATENRILIAFNISAGSYGAPELLRVTSVTDATHLAVQRGVGGTTALPLNSGTLLVECGSAFEEASTAPTARVINITDYVNYTQIFRDKWDVSGTAEAVAFEPNVELVSNNMSDARWFHAQNMEWSFLFSRKQTTTGPNGKPIRYMDGIESLILQFAANNVNSAGATTTYSQLEGMLHPTLDYVVDGQPIGEKTIFCGATALEVINNIGRTSGYYALERDNTWFGMRFMRFRTSRGTWDLIEHPMFNSNAIMRKAAMIADLGSFDVQWLRETTHKDIAFDGTDASSGVYTSECTIEVNNPLGWGMIYNLTAAA